MSSHKLHHPSLYLTSKDVISGAGIKSTSAFHRGAFLGFYSGNMVSENEYTKMNHTQQAQSFAITQTNMLIVRADRNDLITFVNEPPPNREANAVAIPLYLDHGNAVAYYARKFIPPHTEIWAHYGDIFRRHYKVGKAGDVPRHIQRADEVIDPKTMKTMAHKFCAKRTL